MTPKQMIRKADNVFVEFGLAAVPGFVSINVTKAEALRLIDAHELPADDSMHEIGSVGLHDKIASITFAT